MISSLKPSRRGVATYLQTFILIAVALGGSLLAFREVSAYANSSGGPSVQIWDASLRQGAGIAIERLTVSNSGTTVFPYIVVLNPHLNTGVGYCYTVASVAGRVVAGTCPTMVADPTSIRVASNLTSGSTVVVTIILQGSGVVSEGTAYPVLVVAPGGVASSEQVVAAPG